MRYIAAILFLLSLPGAALADELGEAAAGLRAAIEQNRAGGSAMPEIAPEAVYEKGAPAAAPKDDLKPAVIRHLDRMIAYCDARMDDCNGKDLWLRDFAKGIGGGRCNNRGFNCVGEVLDMCKRQLEDGEVTPMYYMACGAMLGKMGERDCAEGRATCAGQLQGAVYFSLRAAAGCHKSYEENKARQAEADRQMERFARTVNQNVKDVYVGHVEQSHSAAHHLVWHAGKEAGIIGTEKVLEFAFERLAMHGAGAAVSAAGLPLFAFSTVMLFHEIAASEMNELVCTRWDHYYKGSYGNVSGSLAKMTGHIR